MRGRDLFPGIVALTGCTFDDVRAALVDGGSVDASTTYDAVCVRGCEGDILVDCAASGPISTECSLGCSSKGEPHCASMAPSNGVTTADLVAVIAADAVISPAHTEGALTVQ